MPIKMPHLYESLEPLALALDDTHQELAEKVRTLMDSVWAKLSPDDKSQLNSRGDLALRPPTIKNGVGYNPNDPLPPVIHNEQSAWPALVDRGQAVMGPMQLGHLLQLLLRLDKDQRQFLLSGLEEANQLNPWLSSLVQNGIDPSDHLDLSAFRPVR